MIQTDTIFYTASRLCKITQTHEELENLKSNIAKIAGNPDQEQQFFQYCKQNKLAPWIKTQLERNGFFESFSTDTRQLFTEIHTQTQARNKARNAEAVTFLCEFEKAGIDVAILKGNMLLHTVYKDSGYKRMNDFDILVHKEDWLKIQDIYVALGYIPLGFGWGGEREKPADYSHVGMSFISPNFDCIIGTQWGLKSPTTKFTVDIEDAWKTASDFDFLGVKTKQLSSEYNLLHLILHLGIYKCGTRDLMDIFNLLLSLPNLDEDRLVEVLHKSNAIEKAYFALKLTNLASACVPDSLLEKLKESKHGFVSKRLKKRLSAFSESQDIHVSYNDYFQDIEKNVIYFGLFPKFHKKLVFYVKIISQIYFPDCKTALKLTDKAHKPTFLNKVKARFSAPYYVFSLLAQEIGWKFTVLLYLKLFFDLIFSLKNYIFPQESYFQYLKRNGIDAKKMKETVQGIQ